MRDVGIGETVNDFYLCGQASQARSQNDGGGGVNVGVLLNPGSGFLNGL